MLNPKETNDKTGRFTAIHKADIVDAKMNDDGTVTMKIVDYYDFTKNRVKSDYTKEELKNNPISIGENMFNEVNNRAYEQQSLGKLKPYAIYFEFTYHL